MQNSITGKIAELEFLQKALEQKLVVAMPAIDQHWDFVIVGKNRSLKVQVKSTSQLEPLGGYHVLVAHGNKEKKKYSNEMCDFMAVYLTPIDMWYIIPLKVTLPTSIRVYPNRDLTHGKWEFCKEAWHLLHEALAAESFNYCRNCTS